MNDFVSRLVRCGFAKYEATTICNSMLKDFGAEALEELVSDIERDHLCGCNSIQTQLEEM